MKMKIKDLLQADVALKQLPELPFKASYRIGRISKRIASEVAIYHEARNKMIIDLGEQKKDEKGEPVPGMFDIADTENRKKFLDQEREMMDEEVEIEVIPTKAEELGDIKIKPEVIGILDFLFE